MAVTPSVVPATFEVHLAVEVLNALDVSEGSPCARLLVGDKAAGNTGDRSLDGHTCIHQSQRGAADGSLRRRAVGGTTSETTRMAYGNSSTDGITGSRAFSGQCAVADLAAGGGAARTGFAGGPLRHIIVVDIAALGLVIDGVEFSARQRGCSACRRTEPASGRG